MTLTSRALEGMVEKPPEISSRLSQPRLRDFLERSVETISGGNRAALCASLGLGSKALNGIFNKGERPTLPLLLHIARGLCVDPGKLLRDDSQQSNLINMRNVRLLSNAIPRAKAARPGPAKRIELESRLENIIKDEDDVRTVTEIARELGITRLCLKYWYPELYLRARTKTLATTLARRKKLKEGYELAIRDVVAQIRKEGMYPARRRIDSMLRNRRLSLMQPDVRAAYRAVLRRI